jgi:hypothetical protein
MVLLMALGLVAVWQVGRQVADRLPAGRPALSAASRRAGPVVATGLAAFLVAVYLGQSLPLRQHDEWGGTYDIAKQVAALGDGRQGVFLWQQPRSCCGSAPALLAAPLSLEHDQVSTFLPVGDPAHVAEYVRAYLQHFRDQPVFLVYYLQPAPALPGVTVTRVREFAGKLPRWMESSIQRPDRPLQIPYRFTVYRAAQAG